MASFTPTLFVRDPESSTSLSFTPATGVRERRFANARGAPEPYHIARFEVELNALLREPTHAHAAYTRETRKAVASAKFS